MVAWTVLEGRKRANRMNGARQEAIEVFDNEHLVPIRRVHYCTIDKCTLVAKQAFSHPKERHLR